MKPITLTKEKKMTKKMTKKEQIKQFVKKHETVLVTTGAILTGIAAITAAVKRTDIGNEIRKHGTLDDVEIMDQKDTDWLNEKIKNADAFPFEEFSLVVNKSEFDALNAEN